MKAESGAPCHVVWWTVVQQALTAMHSTQRCHFRTLFPDASAAAVDLLEAMLQFDPRKRITVEQARMPCLPLCIATQQHSPGATLLWAPCGSVPCRQRLCLACLGRCFPPCSL